MAPAPNAGRPSSRTRSRSPAPSSRTSRSPAPSSRSPALNRAAPNGTPQRVATAPTGTQQRPPYHSDGDSRPVLRGRFYEVVNRSLARPLLTAYLLALGGFCYTGALTPVGLFCRLLHAAVLAANCIFSDELHNCDKRLGGAARSKCPLVTAAHAATHRSIGTPACPGLPSGPERGASPRACRRAAAAALWLPHSPMSPPLDPPGAAYLKPQSKQGTALTTKDLAKGRTYPWAAKLCGVGNVVAVESAVQLIDWIAATGVRLAACHSSPG